MRKPTIIILVLIFLVGLVSASNCEDLYFFQIDHLKVGNILEYSNEDVKTLANQINLTINETYNYLTNYSIICNSSPQIPSPKIEINESDDYNCYYSKINKTIAWVYEADWSIPIPKIHLGKYSCAKIENWKWLLNYEKTGKFDYSIVGVKLWIFIVLCVCIVVFSYIKLHIRANKLINKNR